MEIHKFEVAQVFTSLKTSINGLSDAEAVSRLNKYGRNEIKEGKKISISVKFLKQFTNFFAILLWIAAFLSFFANFLNPHSDMLPIGISIIFVILINGFFSFIQEFKTEKAIEEMRKLLPQNVKVFRNGISKRIPSMEVVPGDHILLEEGDKIPADARIIESEELLLNISPLTGESMPVYVSNNPSTEESYLRANNLVFSGTYILKGNGKAIVYATGHQTEYGKIAEMTQNVNSGIGHIEKEINHVSKVITIISLSMGITFFILGSIKGINIWITLIFVLGIIVANVPEGLLPTVTMALAIGSRRMAKRNFIVRTLDVIENLGAITVIASDKTGTITENKMTVIKIFDNETLVPADNKPGIKVLEALSLSSNESTGDPTEVALKKYTTKHIDLNYFKNKFTKLKEFSFDYELKRVTTINQSEGKYIISSKGAFESIIYICTKICISGKNEILTEEKKINLENEHNKLAKEGFRLIAISFKESEELLTDRKSIESEMVFAGIAVLNDPARTGVREAVEKCKKAGIRVIMITGDNPLTAAAIAKETGIISDTEKVLTGEMIFKLTDFEIKERLSQNFVIARATPEHKLKIITVLKNMNEIVAVTGDGVNDAPALKKADVGIAMGSGTDVAKEVSDAIITDDNFVTIIKGIEEGRACFDNIRKFITYILASNVPEIVPFIAFFIFGIPLALIVPQILAIDLGTDLIPAIALGAEEPETGVMDRPPRNKKDKILTKGIFFRAYGFLGLIEAVLSMAIFIIYLHEKGISLTEPISFTNPVYMEATTLALTAIVFSQIGNGFAVRSDKESIFKIGFLTNKYYLYGIIYELVLLFFLIYTPFLQRIFGTVPFDLSLLIYILPMPLILLLLEESRKLLVKKLREKHGSPEN